MLQKLYLVIWKFRFVLIGAIVIGCIWGWQVAQQQSMFLVALDSNSGAVQWFQPLGPGKDFYSRGAIAAGGVLMLESAESSKPEQKFDTYRLQAFSAQSGVRLWTTQLNASAEETTDGFGYSLAANSVIQLEPTALYLQVGDKLRLLEPKTGQQRWEMKRPWYNAGERADLWLSLGVAATQERVTVVQSRSNPQLIQILDAATGKVLRQTPIPSTDSFTNFSQITQNDRQVFTTLRDRSINGARSDEATVIAYNTDTGQVQFRVPDQSYVNKLQAAGNLLQLSTNAVFDSKQPERKIEGRLVAIDAQTGRLRWQRLDSELNCFNYRSTWQADAQSVYLNCERRRNEQSSSTIVALSAQTGQIQWQSLISPNWHSDDVPMTMGARQLLLLRQARQDNRTQTQAIALDRQTGKLLWTVALFEKRALFFRSRLATERDQFFVTDMIPRWQLWLLRLNPQWYLNAAITPDAEPNR